MKTLAPSFLAIAIALASPAAGQSTSGWTVSASPQSAVMRFGPDAARGSFRMDCSGGRTSLTTWENRLPRGVTEGQFDTRLRVFQGKTERDFGASGQVQAAGGARIDALLPDGSAFLTAMGANSRLVVVTYAGRATAPAPTAEQLLAFDTACRAAAAPRG
jgi:hypothetical protein